MQNELFPHWADLMLNLFVKLHLGLYPVEMMSNRCLEGQTNHEHWFISLVRNLLAAHWGDLNNWMAINMVSDWSDRGNHLLNVGSKHFLTSYNHISFYLFARCGLIPYLMFFFTKSINHQTGLFCHWTDWMQDIFWTHSSFCFTYGFCSIVI